MSALLPLCFAAGLGLCSWHVSTVTEAAQARRRSVFAAATVAAQLFAALLVEPSIDWAGATGGLAWLPAGWLRTAPFTVAVVTVLATAMAPLGTHTSRTFGRVLLLSAHAQATLGVSSPVVLVGLWAWSAQTVAAELLSSPRGQRAHRVFTIYQGVSVLALGISVLLSVQVPASLFVLVALLVAIGLREAVLPGHSWFPRFVDHAPMAIVVMFAGPQLGVFVQLTLVDSNAMAIVSPLVSIVGGVTAVLAAMLGVSQRSVRRALAYLIMSQSGLIAFGLASNTTIGLTGAVLNWQVLALATSGLAMTLAALEARRGVLVVGVPGGSFARTPRMAAAFLMLGLASVGFPLTLGFIAEDLLLQGTIAAHPMIGFSLVVATAFNGVTVVRLFFCLFAGSRERSDGEQDFTPRERWAVATGVVVLVVLGVAPRLAIAPTNTQTRDPVIVHGNDA